jgi:hypothetical protein
MVQAGVPLDVVQGVLAHENIQTTQRYAHRAGDAKKRALDAIPSNWRQTEKTGDDQAIDKKQKS